LAQFTSVFGILTDVDWCSTVKSLGEVVRVKIQCKDPALVPKEWFFEMEKKIYKIGIVTELPNKSADKGEDPQDPSDPGADGDQGSGKTNMDTEQENASRKSNNGPQSGNKSTAPEPSNSNSAKHRKANVDLQCALLLSPKVPMSDAIPPHLENARKDILAWLTADKLDEDRCYNLLREMELVNEDGYFNYEQEDNFDQDQEGDIQTETAPAVPLVSVPINSQKAPTWVLFKLKGRALEFKVLLGRLSWTWLKT
jgi:hypothetical protein